MECGQSQRVGKNKEEEKEKGRVVEGVPASFRRENMHHSMLPLIISCTRSWNFAWHLLWRSTTDENIVKLLAISQTIHIVCCDDDYFPKAKILNYLIVWFHLVYLVFPKSLFSIADLFTVCYLWVVCNEDKCCVVTQRAADIRVSWLVCLACLRSHVLRAYCNFESKQANSITLFGQIIRQIICSE